MKNIVIIIGILLSNINFCQEKTPELILQEFQIEYTEVYRSGEDWVFIDKVCSDVKLSNPIYELSKTNTLDDLLKVYSFDEDLKYKYYFCDVYEFSTKEGLMKTRTILLKDLSYIKKWKKAILNSIKEKEIKTKYKCNSFDVNPSNFVFTTLLKSKVLTIESEGNYFYVSLFNKDCNVYERIKINQNEFFFLEKEDYFVLRGKKSLMLIADGSNE